MSDPITVGGDRLVVHIQTSPKAVDDFISLLEDMVDEKKNGSTESQASVEKTPTNGATERPTTDYRDRYVRVQGKPKA